jgi:AraC-like DNA-binding protein
MNNYLVQDIIYFCNISKNGTHRLWIETIPYYDLTIVSKGELHYTANGKPLILRKNDVMLLPPGTVRTREIQAEYVKYVSFNFSTLDGVSLPFEQYMPNSVTDKTRKILSLIPEKSISPNYHAKATHINLLNCILFELLDAVTFKSSNDHVHNIIKYIEENITQGLTLQSISKEIGLTKEYTAYIFKKETGRTVTEYINERKMFLAKELISHGEMSLSELSSYLGYKNYTYFSRLFKRHFNVSPRGIKPH